MGLEAVRDRLVSGAPGWVRRAAQLLFRRAHRDDWLHERRRRRGGKPTLGGDVRRVMVVCYGNICRSPFAEHRLRARDAALEVRSSGLEAREDKPAQPFARDVAREFGLDLDAHGAHRMNADDVEWADLVIAMEGWQAAEIERRWPQARGKTHLLGDFLDRGPFGITDPYGFERDVFTSVFSRIDESIDALAASLRSARDGGSS